MRGYVWNTLRDILQLNYTALCQPDVTCAGIKHITLFWHPPEPGAAPAGLLPHRLRKNKELLAELTRDASMRRSPGQVPSPEQPGQPGHGFSEAAVLADRQQSNGQAGASSPVQNHSSPGRGMQKCVGSSPDALSASRHSRCASVVLWKSYLEAYQTTQQQVQGA